MPVVKVPLHPYTDYPALRKRRKLLEERVALYLQQQAVKTRLDVLNFELFGDLRSALPADVKSVEVEFEGDDYQVTTLSGGARRTFDREAAVTTAFKCPCRACKGKEKITIPAKVLDGCYKTGKESKPTISVRRVGEKNDDES
jgi:hypothetical protein